MFATAEGTAAFFQDTAYDFEITPQGLSLSTLGLRFTPEHFSEAWLHAALALGCNLFELDFAAGFSFAPVPWTSLLAERSEIYTLARFSCPDVACFDPWQALEQASVLLSSWDLLLLELPDKPLDSAACAHLTALLARCEMLVDEALIAGYALSTPAFVASQALPLESLLQELTAQFGNHHLQAIGMPLNLIQNGAWLYQNAVYGGKVVTPLELALAERLAVYVDSPLMGGALLNIAPEQQAIYAQVLGQADALGCALQFARSVPGVQSALLRIEQLKEIAEALKLLQLPRLDTVQVHQLLRKL